MDPAFLIFLLYVMIIHDLVCGLMEHQRQATKPKKQPGPVWTSGTRRCCTLLRSTQDGPGLSHLSALRDDHPRAGVRIDGTPEAGDQAEKTAGSRVDIWLQEACYPGDPEIHQATHQDRETTGLEEKWQDSALETSEALCSLMKPLLLLVRYYLPSS
ncbi:UNVERIFIED_CONTAM: hypothetical protein FKN15_071082 [Acipenser sinensis]